MSTSISPVAATSYAAAVPAAVQTLASTYEQIADPLGVTPSTVTTLSTEAMKYLSGAASAIADEASSIGSSIASAAKSGVQAVENGIDALESGASTAIDKAGQWVKAGEAAVSSAATSLEADWNAGVSAVESAASSVASGVGSAADGIAAYAVQGVGMARAALGEVA